MPAPDASLLFELAKQAFREHALVVPLGYSEPRDEEKRLSYRKAFPRAQRSVAPVPMPPALVLPVTKNWHHVEAQKRISEELSGYLRGVADGLAAAWKAWQAQATLSGVVVMGPMASGGAVAAPPFDALFEALAPSSTAQKLKYSAAIARAVGAGWSAWAGSLSVPGLPWYPAFAAFPASVAPPMPNVPAPLAALGGVTAGLSRAALASAMRGALGDPKAPFSAELFDAVAFAVDQAFGLWRTSTLVTNVLGTGPIPTFAPPITPVGPVVGGTATMSPGGLV